MRCGCYLVNGNEPVAGIVIDNKGVYIEDRKEKQIIDVDSKECFNTLASLYSLKENWNKEKCERPVFKILFEEALTTQVYSFNLNKN